jgi:GDP-4-dehydro-6-deoxy-D-mannose reductase
MKSLITGIDGFVGSHLAEHLLHRNEEVAGTYHFDPNLLHLGALKSKVENYYIDFRDHNRTIDVLRLTKPDRIYHLAAVAFVPASFKDPRLTFDVNLLGTMTLYDCLEELGLDPLILFISTAEVYGPVSPEELPLTEQTCPHPVSPYSISKFAAELMSHHYVRRNGRKIVCLRPFNHTGPRQAPVFVCSDFAKQIAEIEKDKRDSKMFVGNLDARRDFTDVRDMVRAYSLALDRCPPDGDVYVVGSGKSVSIREVLNILLSLSKVKIRVEQDRARLRPSDIPDMYGDSAKFKKATGWAPKYKIEETLHALLDYWRANV